MVNFIVIGEKEAVYPTRVQCELARRMAIRDWEWVTGNCYSRVEATPCVYTGTGPEPTEIGEIIGSNDNNTTSGNVGLFSNNPANQIRDGAEDNAALMDLIGGVKTQSLRVPLTKDGAFNKQLQSDINDSGFVLDDSYLSGRKFRPLNADTSSDDFKWRNVDMNNVNSYLSSVDRSFEPSVENTDAYMSWINQQFKEITGIDMEAIQEKSSISMTNEEEQAILDYEVFASRLISEGLNGLDDDLRSMDLTKEKHDADMAAIMLAPYGNAEKYLEYTNYRQMNSYSLDDNDPMRQVAEALEACNMTNKDTGWHAELYYNELTNSYAITIAGTNPDILSRDAFNDVSNDVRLAFGMDTPQYNLSLKVAEAINSIQPKEVRDKLQIDIVGHSLGGGAASIIGLATGKPTYTYNAAGVSDITLKEMGLLDKKETGNYRITAYHTSNDAITNAQSMTTQNKIGASSIGTHINIGNVSDQLSQNIGGAIGAAVGSIIPGGTTIGAKIGEGIVGHKGEPIANYFINKSGDSAQRCHSINTVKKRYSSTLNKVNQKAMSAHNYTIY